MGLVFMAEQAQPVRRKVALKILKPGMDTRQVVARFAAERQALALMDHPHIAHFYDAGTTATGRPYFVMELVRGVPITEFCDQRRLTPRQRLELFVTVCQAVQHAHQKGIIHRDLKPSNVLVTLHDTVAIPKVIDFGIAKATTGPLTERTLFTGFAQLLGTPLYLSPEQAEMSGLDVDTRSDVYALGVMLYELLTGTTPFASETLRKASYDELRRIIREEEPPRPSQRVTTLAAEAGTTVAERRGVDGRRLSQLLRGELDWIVLKALEKDRNRRYESASALAADVQRYLHDEPVEACPPSAWYKLRKFARRRKGPLLVAACVLLAVTMVAVTVGWSLWEQANRKTQVEGDVRLAIRDAELLQEQKKWREAAAAAQRALGMLRAGPANAALQQAVEERVADLTLAAQLEQIFTDGLLRLAERHWETLSDPEIDARYARAFQDAGIDVQALGVATAAEKIRRRGIRAELAAALDDWTAVRQYSAGKKDPFWRQLLELANAVDPDPFRMDLRKSWAEWTLDDAKRILASPELLDQPAAVLHSLAGAVVFFERKGQAWQEVLLTLHRRRPGDFWINFELGSSERSSPVEALRYSAAAVALRPDNAGAHHALGKALRRLERCDDALAEFRIAVQLRPGNADTHLCLAEVLGAKGLLDEAVDEYREALQLIARRPPEPRDAHVHNDLGVVLARQGKQDEAIPCFQEAIRLNSNLADAHSNLGAALMLQGRFDEALARYRKAVRLKPDYAYAHNSLAWLLATCPDLHLRDPRQAVTHASKAVELTPGEGECWNTLGVAQYRNAAWKEAVEALTKSVQLSKGGDSSDFFFLAMAHWQLGEKEQARTWYEQAVQWMDKHQPQDEELRRFRTEAAELLGISEAAAEQKDKK
jgi:tetratricopeptide (TPR) repeat protein